MNPATRDQRHHSTPQLTRVHAAALMTGRCSVLAWADNRLHLVSPDGFLAMGRGRILLCRSDLLDAGAEYSNGRFTPGSGPIVDQLLHALNRAAALPPGFDAQPPPRIEEGRGL